MHEITQEGAGKFRVSEGRKVEFLALPSGEILRPANIDAIRVQSEAADRRTGEVSAKVHIQHMGSWFTVRFESEEDARAYTEALGNLCNRIARDEPMGDEPIKPAMSRRSLQTALDDMRLPSEQQ